MTSRSIGLATLGLVASATVAGALAIAAGSSEQRDSQDVLETPPPNILVNDPTTDVFPTITQIEPSRGNLAKKRSKCG